MARKVIIDCDPGIDDAIALALALFDSRLEVVGITACAGTVDADQATRNVHAIVEKLDPPRAPRIGAALEAESGAAVSNGTQLHGEDGLGNVGWAPASRQHLQPADKLISDLLRADPGRVSILCLGPLTGVAKALNRDPGIVPMVDRVVIAGGSRTAIGDVTPVAEFNMHFDPESARSIFQSPTTKSLIPLEMAESLSFGWELVEQLPATYSRVGEVLHKIIPHLCRSNRQMLGRETISLPAVLGLFALVEPMLFEWEETAADVEPAGELTRGMTVFDMRQPRVWRANMEIAVGVDEASLRDAFLNALKFAGQNS